MWFNKIIVLQIKGAIDEINQSVASNSEKNNTLIQENVQLTTKLKNLIDQYELREQVSLKRKFKF